MVDCGDNVVVCAVQVEGTETVHADVLARSRGDDGLEFGRLWCARSRGVELAPGASVA